MRCADLRWIAVLAAVAGLLFTLAPGIDLWGAGLFYRGEGGFPLGDEPTLIALRAALRWTNLGLAVLALAMLALSLTNPAPLGVARRLWAEILALYVVGPGLLVNALLKEYWGRARPADTLPFGGAMRFTPPFEITDQCASNCSFVSGEAAGATATAITLAWLSRGMPPGRALAVRLFGVAFAVTASALRVMKGRHFLSDVIFAALLVMAVAAAIDCLGRRLARR